MKKEISPDKTSFFRSITFRLVIIVALFVLLSGTVSTVFTTSKVKNQLINDIQKQQLVFSEYISNNIDIEIGRSLVFFTNLADELSKKHFGSGDRLITKLQDGIHVPPGYQYGVILISPDGKRLIAEYPVLPGQKELSFVQSEWFQRAKLADQAVISRPFKNRINQKPSIVFAAPVKNIKNKVIAVVAGLVEIEQAKIFKNLYSSAIKGNADIIVISPNDKLLIASNIPEMVLKPTLEPGRNRLYDKAMNGYRGVGITVNADGVEELAAVTGVESTGWFVAVRLSVKEAYQPVKQLLKSLVIYNVLSAFIIILIIVAALVTMLSPLKKAALLVREMAHGNLPLKKLPVTHKDEVGDLIDGFNSLVGTIAERTNELEAANRKLAALSITDGLTGLGNRRYFDEKLEQEWSRASRTQQPLALGMIDVDWFKKYNDHYGHQMGDECLKSVSNVLSSSIGRTGDLVARYGGEEFAFIAAATDTEGARVIAEKFRETLQRQALPHAGSEFGFVSASIGVAVMTPAEGEELVSLIKAADKALYLAKEQGRNRVALFS
ncbi:sensor domain-containing diguanylate cyclase [Psychromonas aquimarina]|uniref:sensor domain-containing diguanylate cyclase n=1 Tax=Psychromonas aquimarina TaxID=444919 RepID=UPI000427FAB6|nr:diguanylate cyclase [Psychromonas aquimarina]